MSNQTSRKTPPAAPAAPEPARFAAHVWASGNGSLQVPLAGLFADDPSLTDAELTAEEWQHRLDAYLRSERI